MKTNVLIVVARHKHSERRISIKLWNLQDQGSHTVGPGASTTWHQPAPAPTARAQWWRAGWKRHRAGEARALGSAQALVPLTLEGDIFLLRVELVSAVLLGPWEQHLQEPWSMGAQDGRRR